MFLDFSTMLPAGKPSVHPDMMQFGFTEMAQCISKERPWSTSTKSTVFNNLFPNLTHIAPFEQGAPVVQEITGIPSEVFVRSSAMEYDSYSSLRGRAIQLECNHCCHRVHRFVLVPEHLLKRIP